MSPGAMTVTEETPAREIAHLMYAKNIKRVPVVRDGKAGRHRRAVGPGAGARGEAGEMHSHSPTAPTDRERGAAPRAARSLR